MRSRRIETRPLLCLAVCALILSGFVLYRTQQANDQRVTELLNRNAELALQYNLAVREYVAEHVRPFAQQQLPDSVFIPEVMSTSYAARDVFERVQAKFPDFVLKFSSDDPRNPANDATEAELAVIKRFRDDPELTRWSDELELNGGRYIAHFSARRMTESCLGCHGEPDDAPFDLIQRYGDVAGFHRPVGDVIALDTVAIPSDEARMEVIRRSVADSAILLGGLLVAMALVFAAFRMTVTRRIRAMAEHFQGASDTSAEPASLKPFVDDRPDEIGSLARSFNGLVQRLVTVNGQLEQRVTARTAALRRKNHELEQQVATRTAAEAQLHESRRQLTTLLAHLPGMAYRCRYEQQWTMLFVSDGVYDLTGYHPEELIENMTVSFADLVHPDDREMINHEVSQAIDQGRSYQLTYRIITREGRLRWVWEKGTAVSEDAGGQVLEGFISDITDRKLAEDKLRRDAERDQLTDLVNRAFFTDHLNRAVALARNDPEHRFAVLFMDIDRFKLVNDSLGHVVGDRLLVAIADRLDKMRFDIANLAGVGAEVTIARHGGDEFALLIEHVDAQTNLQQIAALVHEELYKHCDLDDHRLVAEVSIGITSSDLGYQSPDEVLRDADTAMYHAKARSSTHWALFNRKMHDNAMRRLTLENDLRQAIDDQQFFLLYQPLVNAVDGRTEGFEALIRWEHPKLGNISPLEFIGIAEETSLIVPIGRWVLHEAGRQLQHWLADERLADDLYVSVNLSKRQLLDAGLLDDLTTVLSRYQVPPHCMKLEITESTLMDNVDLVLPVLRRIKALGVALSLDDFGTGHSSLAQLHRFPVDVLKMDRGFVQQMCDNPQYPAVVQAVITLAHNLKMTVVAEGVETSDQLVQLQALECDAIQGYLFSRPVPPDQAAMHPGYQASGQ